MGDYADAAWSIYFKQKDKMIPNKIFISKDLFRWSFDKPSEESDIKYLRKDAVVSTIKDYLENWLDAYKVERLIDKITEL